MFGLRREESYPCVIDNVPFCGYNRCRISGATRAKQKFVAATKGDFMKQRTVDRINSFFAQNANCEYMKKDILAAIEILTDSAKNGKILTCGNGGSAADSEHISGELLKSFVLKREIDCGLKQNLVNLFGEEGQFLADNLQGGIKCIPLTSLISFNTAYLNDCNEKMVFAQSVNALGASGDTLVAISTSGNAKNVGYAAKVAKAKGMNVVALTGEKGGALKDVADVTLAVPATETFMVQEYHIRVYHLLCMAVESELFNC